MKARRLFRLATFVMPIGLVALGCKRESESAPQQQPPTAETTTQAKSELDTGE